MISIIQNEFEKKLVNNEKFIVRVIVENYQEKVSKLIKKLIKNHKDPNFAM
jgi:hypothetical protein